MEIRKHWSLLVDVIPARVTCWLMMLGAVTMLFTLRTNLSISILAMVEPTAYPSDYPNTTRPQQMHTPTPPDFGPRQHWSPYEQSLVLGSFYWGYIPSMIPIGVLTDKYSLARLTVGVSLLIASALTVLTPFAVRHSLALTLATRTLMGLTSSGAVPAIHQLIARWSPAREQGRFLLVVAGVDVGTVLAWSLCGLVIESAGWPWSFYGNGALGVLFAALWTCLVHSSPAQHPRITDAEREYIEKDQPDLASVAVATGWPPIGQILRSMPFWALQLAHFGNIFGFYVVITGVPRFMYEVLGFEMAASGVVASAPHAVRPVGAAVFAVAADGLLGRRRLSRAAVRKGFVVFSHILAGSCFLLLVAVVGHWVADIRAAAWWCVASIVVAAFFNGAQVVTTNQNAHDLAPNFASSLNAIISAVSTTAGFLAPLFIARVTRDANTLNEWQVIFGIVGIVYILSGCVFMMLGSVRVQKWNCGRQ